MNGNNSMLNGNIAMAKAGAACNIYVVNVVSGKGDNGGWPHSN